MKNELIKVDRWWNVADREKSWEKTCSSVTLTNTNPVWNGLGLNPGLQTEGLILDNILLA